MPTYIPLAPMPIQFQHPVTSKNMSGGSIEAYIAGTTTPTNLYSDSAGTSIGPRITLNAGGFPESGSNVITLYRDADIDLKLVLKDESGAEISTSDPIKSPASWLTQSQIGQSLYPITDAEISAGVTPTSYYYEPGDVRRYGATGDGVTDDTAAIRNAQSVLNSAGGGELVFEGGKTYLLSSTSTHTVRVPVAATNYQPDDQSHSYHILMDGVENIIWRGNGATIKSNVEGGGEIFLLDGVRNFEVHDLNVLGPLIHDSSGIVTTSGMNCFGFTSQDRDSYNIKLRNVYMKGVYAGFYAFGDTASSYRVRGISIDNLRTVDGIYTIACHNNGDDLTAVGCQSINTNREYFIYGVHNHDVQMYSDTAVGGFGSNIKAYDADTTQIKYKLRTKRDGTYRNINVESQHNVGVQPTPARVIGLEIDVNNKGNTANNGRPVTFAYYQDAVLTSTSTKNLFDGIILKGIAEQAPDIASTQDANGARGTLNTDELVLLNGSLYSLYEGTGFLDSKQTYNTFTPVMKLGGATTGITYSSSTIGEFWRDGRFVEVVYRIVLTSKGSETGTLTLDLPVDSSGYAAGNALVQCLGSANMSGIGSVITGFVARNGSTLTLQEQGAASATNLDNTNLTNTSDFMVHARYPI